jgi:adenylate cyclase class 2
MQIEYEATFYPIEKDDIRSRLKQASAELVRPEFMQKRMNFNLPEGHDIQGAWIRVRDEGDKITLTLKIVDGNKIENQKEIITEVKDYDATRQFLEKIGCTPKAFQETKRELWRLGEVEIMIDEWPWLKPFVEIEGKSEAEVRKTSELLGFKYDDAYFCAVDTLYAKEYGISKDEINHTQNVSFAEANPFKK